MGTQTFLSIALLDAKFINFIGKMTGTSCPKWLSQDPYCEFNPLLHFSNYRPTLMWFLSVG
jgi:hypothetical protein